MFFTLTFISNYIFHVSDFPTRVLKGIHVGVIKPGT